MTYIVHTTEEFDSWLKALRDIGAAARIFNRMRNAEDGNFGATAPIGKGVGK